MSFKSKSQNHLNCDVCKINISTEAEFALHEFSKRHCDNLLRIAKNKPIVSKQKTAKAGIQTINKEQPKINTITTKGNFAKYGYFVQGEVYDTKIESKEFNTEYDPYLQKYAKNPLQEQSQSYGDQCVELPSVTATNITSFKRKKKKRIKTCQICNLSLPTVPEYEAHMRSPEHSWKLKLSGMGVSAHFVKASSDLHTVEMDENSTIEEFDETSTKTDHAGSGGSHAVFPTLYCDICELLLNSEQQYNAHVNGKSHNDNVQRKVEIRAKKQELEKVCLNQLYCFSCKVALNNLQQYSEHKFGKKHKMKCRRLMREGITIPPEERVPTWEIPRVDPKKPVVYPEMYEKFLIETQRKGSIYGGNECKVVNTDSTDDCFCQISTNEPKVNSEDHQRLISGEPQKVEGSTFAPKVVFHRFNNNISQGRESGREIDEVGTAEESLDKEQINRLKIISCNETFKCSVCGLNFMCESEFGSHLSTEVHARKILELKNSGISIEEILNKLVNDISIVKPDNLGRYTCCVCSVTTGSLIEYDQHISSVVHKQTEEEFQRKREIEVKSVMDPDETGNFTCKICREGFTALTEFNHHLHTAKHREGLKTEKVRKMKMKKRLLLQQRRVKQKYIISGLKRKNFACWRRNCEKNPSMRTKISETESVIECKDIASNPEPSIPKLESSGEKIANKRIFEEEKLNSNKRIKYRNWNVETSSPPKAVKSLMVVNNKMPYLPQPPPLMSKIAWSPYYTQHFMPNYFPGFPNKPRGRYPNNMYQRSWIFQQSRSRYPPCYY